MTELIKTDSANKHFIELVKLLNEDLAIRDGSEHEFYAKLNKTPLIKHAVVLYEDKKPVSCGAMKPFSADAIEIKRMYTLPDQRGKGFASKVLYELEKWIAALGYKKCVLETGKKQPEAIALYKKSGYTITENYGQYAGVENSVCFEKFL